MSTNTITFPRTDEGAYALADHIIQNHLWEVVQYTAGDNVWHNPNFPVTPHNEFTSGEPDDTYNPHPDFLVLDASTDKSYYQGGNHCGVHINGFSWDAFSPESSIPLGESGWKDEAMETHRLWDIVCGEVSYLVAETLGYKRWGLRTCDFAYHTAGTGFCT